MGENIFTCVYIEKIFFSRTAKPEKFKLTWKLADRVQIKVCSNHGPRGWAGPQYSGERCGPWASCYSCIDNREK